MNKTSLILLTLGLLIAGIQHSYNMHGFPYYENDEGTYLSQAYSLLTTGQFAPYTYWYDHAPFGWILLSIFMLVTRGFELGHDPLIYGRVFMLIVHLCNAALVFAITRQATRHNWAAFLAIIISSFSNLATYYQRRILLDNILTPFVLGSIYLLIRNSHLKLTSATLSATLLGLAVLTKETAFVFIPAFLLALVSFSNRHNALMLRTFAVSVLLCVLSLYPIYALINSELLPSDQHVSLVGTIIYQLQRGSNLPFYHPQSDFRSAYSIWTQRDYYSVVLGITSILLALPLLFFSKIVRVLMLAVVGFLAYILRGGLVIDFYIIPLFPLTAILLATGLHYLIYGLLEIITRLNHQTLHLIPSPAWAQVAPALLFIIISLLHTYQSHLQPIGLYTSDETAPQRQALTWIKANLDTDTYMAVDAYALADLWRSGYHNAHWFWKIWTDPEVTQIFQDHQLAYVLASHELIAQTISDPRASLVLDTYTQGVGLQLYGPSSASTYLDLRTPHLRSTNGDWAAIFAHRPQSQLQQAWKFYRDNFIRYNGQVVDPIAQHTTSEGQAYAMQRACLMQDKVYFDLVWNWTKEHMQRPDHLISWQVQGEGQQAQITDFENATDADLYITFELYQAADTWQDPSYAQQADQILNVIKQHLIITIADTYYLLPNTRSYRAQSDAHLLNPSYFTPAYYSLFAQHDPTFDWHKMKEDTYDILFQLQDQYFLPPNWIMVNDRQQYFSATRYAPSDADLYGFDAFRVFHHVSQDARVNHSADALAYLQPYANFFASEIDNYQSIAALYSTDAKRASDYVSLSTNTAALQVLGIFDLPQAQILKDQLNASYNDQGYYQTADNYFDHNWVHLLLLTTDFPQKESITKEVSSL